MNPFVIGLYDIDEYNNRIKYQLKAQKIKSVIIADGPDISTTNNLSWILIYTGKRPDKRRQCIMLEDMGFDFESEYAQTYLK